LAVIVLLIALFLGFLYVHDESKHALFGKLWPRLTNSLTTRTVLQRNAVLQVLNGDNSDSIKLIEIGAGTGENIAFIDKLENVAKINYIGVEPNEALYNLLLNRIHTLNPKFKYETSMKFGGEYLNRVADNSVDYILTTFVLCSVDEQQSLLKEMYRVLKPGGKLLYVEHVLYYDEARLASHIFKGLQIVLTPIWRLIAGGCELHRDTESAIKSVGFSTSPQREMVYPILEPFPLYMPLPLKYGSATK